MKKLVSIRLAPLGNSTYIRPFKMIFEQNGVQKSRDMMEIYDSVAIVIHNITRDVLVFVKQFRPGVYYSKIKPDDRKNKTIDTTVYPAELGISMELCTGIKDKNKSLIEIAQGKVIEETGYKVPIENFEKIHTYNTGVAITPSLITMLYCEVTESMRVKDEKNNEFSHACEISANDFHQCMSQTCLPYSHTFIIGYYWFLNNKFRK